MSSYDPCLLIPKNRRKNLSIVKLETDNAFNVKTETIMNKQKKERIKINFIAKNGTKLESNIFTD